MDFEVISNPDFLSYHIDLTYNSFIKIPACREAGKREQSVSVSALQIDLPGQRSPGAVVFEVFEEQFDNTLARIRKGHVACDVRCDE